MRAHSLPCNFCQNKIFAVGATTTKNACFHLTKDCSPDFCLFCRLFYSYPQLPTQHSFPLQPLSYSSSSSYAWFPHIVWCCQLCLFDIREHIHSCFLFYNSDCEHYIVHLKPSFVAEILTTELFTVFLYPPTLATFYRIKNAIE